MLQYGKTCAHVVIVEVLQVAEDSEPHQQVSRAKDDATQLVVARVLDLDLDLDARSDHRHDVIDDHHDVPEVDELQAVAHRQLLTEDATEVTVSRLNGKIKQ